jgi:hypothetical protein
MGLQLLWIELMANLVVGTLLVLLPRTLARLLGLPPVAEPFWPRLMGVVLIGLAAATLLEAQASAKNGLGLAGHVAINFILALGLVTLLLLGRAGANRRGRTVLWLTAATLALLAIVELAWA